jgi:chitin disaccharide deacetylase
MRRLPLSFLLSLSFVLNLAAQTKSIAERLGYSADSKLLIVHADDLGVAHSVDAASFDALDKNAVSSASIMMTCPWVSEVAAYAKAHADADLGLHLTLTSEWQTYRWGALASKDGVSSLLDPAGTLWSETRFLATNVKPLEAEREIRAQIERAIALGIQPTHLDSHMGALFSTPELFAMFVRVAREYHLPFLAVRTTDERGKLLSPLSEKDVLLDAVVIAGAELRREQWSEFYLRAVKGLKPGLTEMIVHLGYDNAELQAITVGREAYGSAWRQRDYDFVTSPEFKRALKDNHVILIKWKDLQKLVELH